MTREDDTFVGLERRRSGSEREHEFAAASDLAVYRRGSGSGADRTPYLAKFHFKAEHVAGFDLTLESHVVDTRKKGNLVLMFRALQHRHRSDLGDCLNDQYSWHYRIIRKMALKK